MPRFFRLYEKKRGDRTTGSIAFGKFGEALFFGIFFIVGCLTFIYMLVTVAWPEWRANRQFVETSCVILEGKTATRPATATQPAQHRPEFRIRYRVNGETYVEDQVYDVTGLYEPSREAVDEQVAAFEVGREYPCWHDQIDPHRVVLVRGYSGWLYVSLLIPLSFIIIGGGRLILTLLHWNTSAERRALLEQKSAQLDLFDSKSSDREFPTVPADANLTNSPGTSLAYRLPIATTTGWTLFAASMACVIWNGIVGMFLVMIVRSILRREPDWMLMLFVVPFLAGGVALLIYLLRQVLITTGVGPTRIEISDHPLSPGEPYEIFLSQAGRLTMNSLEVWLACDEKATYRQGTDTRTETCRVYEGRCYVREKFQIHQGLPFESRCQFQVPEGAMHSFHADHNEVNWKLIVKGSVVGWPDYERVFQIVVKPPINGHSAQSHA